MTRTATVISLMVLGLTGCFAGAAKAQGVARTLDEVHLLVRPGETVRILDVAGRETKGRFESSSPAGLQLRSGRDLLDLKPEDVAEVRVRQQDSLKDGAWKGLGVGVGVAVLVGASCGCPELLVYALPWNVGLFAAVGVGFDALVTHERTIFAHASATASTARYRVAPIVGPGAKGVRVAFQF